MPTRGNARKIGIRVEARPESSPRQYGELADQREQDRHVHAHPVGDVDRLVGGRRGRCGRAGRRSAPGGRRSAARRRGRGSAARRVIRWSSQRATGCVPAEPMRQALACRRCREPDAAARAAPPPASRMSAHGLVEISSTDSISSGLISPSGESSTQVVDRVDQRVACRGRGSSAPPRCRPCTRGR